MIPRLFPVGPDGWTTFWTWAVIVRLVSLRIVTVMCRRPGAAIAVTMRTTDRIGRGARKLFRPQGARRIDVVVAVCMARISSGPRGAGIPSTHPIAPDPPPDLAHIIVPAGEGAIAAHLMIGRFVLDEQAAARRERRERARNRIRSGHLGSSPGNPN